MKARYPADFEAFMKVYPVKVARAAAFTAWQKTAGLRPPLAELLKAVEQGRAWRDHLERSRKFVPAWPYAQG